MTFGALVNFKLLLFLMLVRKFKTVTMSIYSFWILHILLKIRDRRASECKHDKSRNGLWDTIEIKIFTVLKKKKLVPSQEMFNMEGKEGKQGKRCSPTSPNVSSPHHHRHPHWFPICTSQHNNSYSTSGSKIPLDEIPTGEWTLGTPVSNVTRETDFNRE